MSSATYGSMTVGIPADSGRGLAQLHLGGRSDFSLLLPLIQYRCFGTIPVVIVASEQLFHVRISPFGEWLVSLFDCLRTDEAHQVMRASGFVVST